MMRRVLNAGFLAIILSLPQGSQALVEPELSDLPPQRWLAQIYVDDGSSTLKEFCKGALIASQWVLTSGFCSYDPFEALGSDRDDAGAKYVVKLAGSSLYYDVEKYVKSDDLAAGLMKLAKPATIQPVSISSSSAVDLRDEEVVIIGTERTAAVGEIYFNPTLGTRMYCSVDGMVFYGTGSLCYVMPKLVRSAQQLLSRATVIDPEGPGAPATQLDKAAPFDVTGNRLYLDFRADGSYPCNEDLGAPVLRVGTDGNVEIVGIVSGVGMALFPVCSPTLQNRFGTASEYQDFIDTTIAQDAFDNICPDAPVLEAQYPDGTRVNVTWNAVAGATGYRLLYTNGVGYMPFQSLDVGNRTEVSAELSPEFAYTAVIVAYNATCTSAPSDELTVVL